MDLQQLRSDEAAWRVLEERARALMVQDAATATGQGEEFLTFRLGESGYSIPARFIREVQPFGACTALPHTPTFVTGLVNIRGRLIAVLDIRPLLDIPQTAPLSTACLLVLQASGMDVGLLADVVIEVRRSAEALMPTVSAITDGRAAWVRGVDRNLNLVLDPLALLADPRLIVSGASP
jgi:purine-binding chemotaxis protein CheW